MPEEKPTIKELATELENVITLVEVFADAVEIDLDETKFTARRKADDSEIGSKTFADILNSCKAMAARAKED